MQLLQIRYSKLKALVDDEDYEQLLKFKWDLRRKGTISRSYSATQKSTVVLNPSCKLNIHKRIFVHIPLANEIMKDYISLFDHIDRNPFNNQKHNLRKASYTQNRINSTKSSGTSSKHKGVSWSKRDSIWIARINKNGKTITLGRFENEANAALAYNRAAYALYGEFAVMNIL